MGGESSKGSKEQKILAYIILCRGKYEKIVNYINSDDVNVNYQDRFGNTLLYHCLYCDKISILELLLENGADPNIGNSNGHTPLMSICNCRNIDKYEKLIEILISNCADPHIKDNIGNSSLSYARETSSNYNKIERILLGKND